MKFLLFFFFISIALFAQNRIIVDENTEKPMAVGYGDRSIFTDSSFAPWFESEYSSYKVKSIDDSSNLLCDVKITIVMGTWCGDSKREVPRFYKILDELKYPDEKIKLLFVDRSKKGIDGEVEGLDIEFVPTIIFYRNEEEIGRIIESPEETLEEDLISIIK